MIWKRRKDNQPDEARNHASNEPAAEAPDPSYDDDAVERELQMSETDVGGLRELLQQLLEPDTGLEQRTYDAVQQTLLDRETMKTVASLFNLGWRTPKVILMESESPDGS